MCECTVDTSEKQGSCKYCCRPGRPRRIVAKLGKKKVVRKGTMCDACTRRITIDAKLQVKQEARPQDPRGFTRGEFAEVGRV